MFRKVGKYEHTISLLRRESLVQNILAPSIFRANTVLKMMDQGTDLHNTQQLRQYTTVVDETEKNYQGFNQLNGLHFQSIFRANRDWKIGNS